MITDKAPNVDRLDSALQQAWDFPAASEAPDRARGAALLTDLMSSPLDPRDRLNVFQRTLDGVLTLLSPVAIHWQASDRLVDPASYSLREPKKYPDILAGALNVRLFRVESETGDTGNIVMDSRGLDSFGLPDVQCHFRGLQPGRVAAHLCNIAAYLFEHGDVVESGHTVDGLDDGQKWVCQPEEALVPPEREVLDINPGTPFAAGDRG